MSARRESGAVLLVVLVALALLAALAGVATRLSQSGLSGLRGERAEFRRELLITSALAEIGAKLADPKGLPRDGTAIRLSLPGGLVEARVQAASGLVNPNFAGDPVLLAVMTALQATPEQAVRLTKAINAVRAARTGMAFRDLSDLAPIFAADPDLWQRLQPYLTLLGSGRTPDLATTPPFLREALPALTPEAVDFYQVGLSAGKGFYEITLKVVEPDQTDPAMATHVSALADARGGLKIFSVGWPAPVPQTAEGS